MTTLGDLINDVQLALEGWGLTQGRAGFINQVGGITASATSITVDDTTNLSEGLAEIDDELVYIQSASGTTVTIAPDGRGYRGTTATTHADNARITMNPTVPKSVIKQKINDTLRGVYPTLRGKGSTDLTYTAGVTTYNLPAEADEVLQVTYDSVTSTGVWPRVNVYHVDHNADPTAYAGGKSLTLGSYVDSGRTVRVVYTKKPSTLSVSTDLLTSTGLDVTARACVVAGALWRLAGYYPVSTLKAQSVALDMNREGRPDPTRMAAYLRAQYEIELQEEAKRQRLNQPPTLSWS